MGWYERLSTPRHPVEIACRCWTPAEADKKFGRKRPRKGIIHCAKCLGG